MFKGSVFVTVTGPGREDSLVATGVALFRRVTGATWYVCFTHGRLTAEAKAALDKLYALAEATCNTLSYKECDPGLAVGQIKAEAATLVEDLFEGSVFINLDDDHLHTDATIQVYRDALPRLLGGKQEVFAPSVWDMWENDYDDWFAWANLVHDGDPEQAIVDLPSKVGALPLTEFVQEYGAYSLAHQNWERICGQEYSENTYIDLQYIGNCWAVPNELLLLAPVQKKLKEWPRGVRGYDLYLQSVFRSLNMPMYTCLSASVAHTGMHTKESSKANWGRTPSRYYSEHAADRLSVEPIKGKKLLTIKDMQ